MSLYNNNNNNIFRKYINSSMEISHIDCLNHNTLHQRICVELKIFSFNSRATCSSWMRGSACLLSVRCPLQGPAKCTVMQGSHRQLINGPFAWILLLCAEYKYHLEFHAKKRSLEFVQLQKKKSCMVYTVFGMDVYDKIM